MTEHCGDCASRDRETGECDLWLEVKDENDEECRDGFEPRAQNDEGEHAPTQSARDLRKNTAHQEISSKLNKGLDACLRNLEDALENYDSAVRTRSCGRLDVHKLEMAAIMIRNWQEEN